MTELAVRIVCRKSVRRPAIELPAYDRDATAALNCNEENLKAGKLDLVAGELSSDLAIAATRRAKIICTIGPSCNSEPLLREMMRLGMDVARLNFSHGTHQEHARNIAHLRRAARQENRTICILQDLQGPKIRTGRLKGHEPVSLKTGSEITITPRDVLGTATLISTTFAGLAQEVATDSRILLSDGLIELRVKRVHGGDVECDVINGGMLGEHQGINLPGAALSIPAVPTGRHSSDWLPRQLESKPPVSSTCAVSA